EGLLGCAVLSVQQQQGENLSDLAWVRDVFDDRAYALASLHLGPNDRAVLQRMRDAARDARLPLVASNDVHYHVPRRRFLHDVVTAIRQRCTVAELGRRRFANGERYLKPPHRMQE